MKKQIIIFLALFSCSIIFAQKLKVKKDQIFFDKIAVANLTKDKGVFTLSKLDNIELVTIKVEHCVLNNKFYLEFTSLNTKSINQIALTSYSAMNQAKYVALALEEAGFISENGVEADKLNAFIEGEKFDLAKEYGCAFIKEGEVKLVEMNILVDENGVITKGNNIAVGKITRSVSLDVIKYEDYTYKVYDLNKKLLATISGKMSAQSIKGVLVTIDNKSFDIPLEKFFWTTYSFKRDANINMILIVLIQSGYTL